MISEKIKIVLADDHGLFRDSMSIWLAQHNDNSVIHLANCFDELVSYLNDNSYAIILLDLIMPGMQGVISISDLLSRSNNTPILIVSANDNPSTITNCINAGASGYVTKASGGEVILRAISQILSGEKYIPVNISNVDIPVLSDKQKKVLILLTDGNSNKLISEKLYLSEGTVKQYVSQLFRELNVTNRTQAAKKARELLGLCDT